MAQQSFSATKKRHDLRKNPASKEFFNKQRKAQNAARPKQVTITEKFPDGTVKITGPIRAIGV